MANLNLKFLRGLQASLPTTGTDGYFYLTTDTHRLYTSVDGKVVPVNEGVVTVANIAALNDITANAGEFFYATEENVLCVFNGKNFIQINAQKTLAELGGVSQADYDEKIAALEDADEGLDTRLQAAEEKLKSVATTEGLGDLTDRVTTAEGEIDVLQADSHTHTFADSDVEDAIAKKHAHTFADTDVEDAIAKKHSHIFVESELNKIVAGDVAKWNGVVADHLTSADKIAIEDSIGDVNTALENYKTSNNEVLAGVKATADAAATKEYTDAELAKKVTKTDYEADKATFATKAELGDVDAKFANYNTTVAQKAIDDAQDAEIAKKVDKVEGKSLIADSEIERLATLHNYDDTQVKADITKKADAETMTTELGKKVDKVEGYSLVSDTEIARLANVDNYDDAEVRGLIGDNADAIAEIAGDYVKAADIANFETKANVKKVADDLATYVESNDAAIADRYTKSEADGKFAIKGEDAYDDAELVGRIEAVEDVAEANATAIGDMSDFSVMSDDGAVTVTTLAEAVELLEEEKVGRGYVMGIYNDALAYTDDSIASLSENYEGRFAEVNIALADKADKTDLDAAVERISANETAISVITNGIDAEKIDGLNDLIEWADEHAPEVNGIKTDIEANATAIEGVAGRMDTAEGKITAVEGAVATKAEKTYVDEQVQALQGVDTGLDNRLKAVEAAVGESGSVADDIAAAKQEAMDYADETFVAKSDYVTDYQNLEGLIAEANIALEDKADKTDLDAYALAEDVNGQIAEINIALGDKADKTDLDSAVERIAANETAIGTKANAADVYAKTETYTQDEVDAAIEAAVTAATQWGSF